MKRRKLKFRSQYSAGADTKEYLIMIPVLCVLGAALIAVIIGLILDGKTDSSPKNNDPVPIRPDKVYSDVVANTPSAISGYLTSASLSGDISVYTDAFKTNGYDTVSFNLKNPDGTLTFKSEVLSSLSISDAAPTDGLDIGETVKKVHDRGMRAIGIFYSNSYMYVGAARAAYEALEAALICEAGLCGIDEILIANLPCDTASYENILTFVREVSAKTDAKVIVSLPYGAVADGNIGEYCTYLARSADGIAIDFSGYEPDTLLDAFGITEGSGTKLSYYIDRFNARILLSGELSNYLDELIKAGYNNIALIN